jgi:DNA-binding protein H-NS
MKLKSLSIEKLTELRDRVDAALTSKVTDQRRNIQGALARLYRIPATGPRGKSLGRRMFGKVAPKYRNPDNDAETWAGRGLKPRWLAAALKAGKKLEEFSISSPSKKVLPKAIRKKGRKPKKASEGSSGKKTAGKIAIHDKPRKAATKTRKAQSRAKKALATTAPPASPPLPPSAPPDNSPKDAGFSSAEQT